MFEAPRIQLPERTYTSCLTAIKRHAIKNCEKLYERSGKYLFWISLKHSSELLDTIKASDFRAASVILCVYIRFPPSPHSLHYFTP